MPALLLIAIGIVLLFGGGEVLVRGASNVALAFGLSPLIVGLTVVSFATSAPELAVTLDSVAQGSPGLAVGNVVGSNIANVLLVLGVAAIITPLAVRSVVVRRDVPIMVGFSILLTVFALSGNLDRWQGGLLLAGLLAYVVWLVRWGKREPEETAEALEPPWDPSAEPPSSNPKGAAYIARSLLLVAVGVGLLVGGATILVSGAQDIARELGLSEMVIGLTIVAIGTSLPELATAIVATLRGERDLAVGNAVGSNIFNIGVVLGFSALINPGGIPIPDTAGHFDFILMTAVAIVLLPVAYTGMAVARWEGWVFLLYYVAYTVFLLLSASNHAALAPFERVMLLVVLPVTVILIIVSVVREPGAGRRRRASTGMARPRAGSDDDTG